MVTKKIPLRRCIATGEQCAKKDLIRVVRNKEGEVFIDLQGRQNGRGAYLKATLEAINIARKKNSLGRALEVSIPETVYEELERIVNLGLMKRSGNVSYGETLIEDIRKNKVFAVVIASDTGETSKKKIIDKSIFYKVPYFVVSSKEEISKAVGLGNISSVGIKSIGGANKIIKMMKED